MGIFRKTLIKKALDDIPKGSDAIDRAYDASLERIRGQRQGSSHLAMQSLVWITYTHRLLTISELQHALATKHSSEGLDLEDIDNIRDILSVCAGLVVVDQDKVRLLHYTTQEYLARTWHESSTSHHYSITLSCLSYLNNNPFKTSPNCDRSDEDVSQLSPSSLSQIKIMVGNHMPTAKYRFEELVRRYPFLVYAARFWECHARRIELPTLKDLASKFLTNRHKARCAFEVLLTEDRLGGMSLDYYIYYPRSHQADLPDQWSGIHMAAYLGQCSTVSMLLDRGFDINGKGLFDLTALNWAIRGGQEAVVKLLLSRDDVDLNIHENDKWPLWR